MGFFRRIGRVFRRVVRGVGGIVKKGLSLVTKPLAKIIKPFTGIIGKVLDKLPFGNVIKGFLGKFMNSPLAFLAGPLLGSLGAILAGIGGTPKLAQVAQQAAQTPAFQNPQGRMNVMQMIACQHGQLVRGGK